MIVFLSWNQRRDRLIAELARLKAQKQIELKKKQTEQRKRIENQLLKRRLQLKTDKNQSNDNITSTAR